MRRDACARPCTSARVTIPAHVLVRCVSTHRQELVERYGDTRVDVGRIPYASTFGLPSRPTTLAQAVHAMATAPVNASDAPDEYVFASLSASSTIIADNVKVR